MSSSSGPSPGFMLTLLFIGAAGLAVYVICYCLAGIAWLP